MSCDCTVPEFCRAVVRVSRKARACCECSAGIDPGERYLSVSGKWDGNLGAYDVCLFCEELRDEAQRADVCDCIAFGHLFETLAEEFEDDRDGLLLNRLFRTGKDPLWGTELTPEDVEAIEGRPFVGAAG